MVPMKSMTVKNGKKRGAGLANATDTWRQVRLAVLLEGRNEYDRGVLRGVRRFCDQHPGWSLRFLPAPHFLRQRLASWPVSAVLLESWQIKPDDLRRLRQRGVPIVNLCEAPTDLRLPGVGLDNDWIGVMAAEYLLGIRPRSFGFVWLTDTVFAEHRAIAFRRTLTAAGHTCAMLALERQKLLAFSDAALAQMATWLKTLPRPAAVFAANDECALEVLNACGQWHLSVPDEIAVLGVDNDELLCELAQPSLSSIVVPSEKVGYDAAALLETLIETGRTVGSVRLLPPLRVVARRSTTWFDAGEPVTATALRFIQEHLDQPFDVNDVARAAGVCRRLLERRFHQTIRRSPLQEIHRQRLQRAQALLSGSDLPIHRIAVAAGFGNSPVFSDTFKRETGLSPSQYRQRCC